MRLFKNFSIIFTVLLVILTITYNARVSIINNLAKMHLSLIQVKITCLDINLANDMTIIVNKICLQNPKADIEIVDMTIQWQFSPKIKITDIDAKWAYIRGTEHLFSNINHTIYSNKQSKNNQDISELLSSTLLSYVDIIKLFQLPTNINIVELSYLPFAAINPLKASKSTAKQHKRLYTANLSIVDNTFSVSLQNDEKIEFIKVKLANKDKEFSIVLSSKLNQLKHFISTHQLPITTELQNVLNANEVSGSIELLIEYQAGTISIQNQITDIAIDLDYGIGRNRAFKLLGALNFQSRLNLMANKITNNTKTEITDKSNAEIKLTFVGENKLSLEYNQAQLYSMLEKSELSPALISILKGNPLTNLTLKLQNNATLTLNDKKVYLNSVEVSASGDERIHHVNLDHITVVLPHHNITLNNNDIVHSETNIEMSAKNNKEPPKKTPYELAVGSLIIDSQLHLAEIAKFSTMPVAFHLEGSLKKTAKHTTLNLTKNSSIIASNIVVLNQQNNNKKILSLNSLTAILEGSVQLLEDNGLSANLIIRNQAVHVDIPEILQINSLDFISQIKGSLDDININTTIHADGTGLGSVAITGPALSPKIEVVANELQLTDLLSLKIQLPTKVELIDGALSYRITGQLTNLSNIKNTPFIVSIEVTSASGEVDDIWLQELNWQQDFTLLAGIITTNPNASENLTVELIDTPTPISKLSINTSWSFNKNFKLSASQLKADILGGSFSIPKLQWPFEAGHSVNVQLNSINLEQLLALDKKQGIVVTGNISGEIPVTFDGEKYIIKDGELHNINNGLIQVFDNPAVANLKASNSQLQLAFDALQNLHYHQLSSAVSMADDGYMLLETVIKGRNPDINNDVNLNLNLSYDLLGLLESLSITERFEKSIIKGLQKKKE